MKPAAGIGSARTRGRFPVTLLDVALALFALGASLVILNHGGVPRMIGESQLEPVSASLAAVAALALVAWRRQPFAVFVVVGVANALAAALGYAFGLPLSTGIALFLLASTRGDATPWTITTGAAALGLFAAYVIAAIAAAGGVPADELSHATLVWAVAWFAGDRARLRREHVAELEQRAERTDREAARERELAAAEERARIARDLHDSAGHAISVIAVRAGAARLRHDEDPERSRAALTEIEEVARETAGEIDAIVSALRDPPQGDGTVEAPPGLASLATLLRRHSATGLHVTLETTGEPRPLDGVVDLAAYRILQEALTNAARHGTGTAEVELNFDTDRLAVSVANPVRPPVPPSSPGGGHGIVGMRERAALLRGRLEAGRENGGFLLRAELPYQSTSG